MDELALIDWLRTTLPKGERVVLGPGDDCALLDTRDISQLAVTTDTLLEGTHFQSSDDPHQIGWKVVAASVSDLAAMGCRPLWAVTGAGLRRGTNDAWLKAFVQGLADCARAFGMGLVGGDVTSWDHGNSFTLTACGEPFPGGPLRRDGAHAGDVLFVTGALGGSFPKRHLSFMPRVEESKTLCASGAVTAMMDVSDGLALDLRRLCAASGVGAQVDATAIPISEEVTAQHADDWQTALRHALTDGEDFELLGAATPEAWEALMRTWQHPTPIARIGVCTKEPSLVLSINETNTPFPEGGYIHALG